MKTRLYEDITERKNKKYKEILNKYVTLNTTIEQMQSKISEIFGKVKDENLLIFKVEIIRQIYIRQKRN